MKQATKCHGSMISVVITVNSHGEDRAFQFDFDAQSDWAAELLAEKIGDERRAWKVAIIEQAYRAGFTDANRKPKCRLGPPSHFKF